MDVAEAVLPREADAFVAFVTTHDPRTDRVILRASLDPETATFLRILVARAPDGTWAGVAVARAASNQPTGALFSMIWVRPDHRGRGVASRLRADLVADIPEDLTRLTASAFADDSASLAVARHWGFEPVGRSDTTTLDVSHARMPRPMEGVEVTACDDLRFEDERAVEEMLLASQTNPEFELGLVLSLAGFRDTPAPGQRPVAALARVAGAPAAISFAVADGDRMHVVYTGVDPARRGGGLARRTKEVLHAHARELGVRTVLTDNAKENPGIRHVNDQLGYAPHSSTCWLMRPLR
ncbi:GNAT family N-acetyltransferase [Nocardioides sp. YIM 152588]|uniref:GNAT family N-acetyltransferase n=1 Tax=Nocardioides sp. YIM 152588 TaxID=3158259 RepID=UPI0032E3C895